MPVSPKATIDFETRSACNLKTHGTWVYSCHPTTEILCLVWRLPHWVPGRTAVWHPSFRHLGLPECIEADALQELFDWIEAGKLVEAHGVWFEFCIWRNILEARHGWPTIRLEQWRCSGAKAATHALPRGLDKAGKAMKLALTKDVEGSKTMKKMAKPRKSRKAERLAWAKAGVDAPALLWHESSDMLDTLIAYCRVDVLSEEALSHVLPDLNEQETDLFLLDLRMNERGFQIDKAAVKVALQMIHRESVLLNQELYLLTDRCVRKATQRATMLEWLATEGLYLPDTQKGTIDAYLAPESQEELTPKARRALEIMRALGRSSTAKYKAMKNWAGKDGRVRGGLLYHGASTGRWSGKGVQPHNFVKGGLYDPATSKPLKISMTDLWTVLMRGQRPEIISMFRDVMEALATALRGAITAAPGKQLFVADYAAIEARVLLWVAGDEDALQVFREGRDIYCEMAERIYNYPCNKTDHPKERGMGKVAVLGLGYQMGASKFVESCAAVGIEITEEFSKDVVDAYREKFWRVKQLWYDQEAAAIKAVQTGRRVFCGKVCWFVNRKFLYCKLPSGRCLAYAYPKVEAHMTSWGQEKDTLTFMGVDSYTHQWKRLKTYGGMIVENIVQAISRDLMAVAMLRAEATGQYQVVLSVHDELVAEAVEGDVPSFEHLMAACPPWAADCPVSAEGWTGFRYHK